MDMEALMKAVNDMIVAIGENPEREGFVITSYSIHYTKLYDPLNIMKSIRTLTLTVVLGLLLAVTAASYLVNEYVGYRRFIDIEEADVRRDLQVINGLFESRAEDMQRLSRDWAYWTDRNNFV